MNVKAGPFPRLLAALVLASLAACSPPELQDTAPRSDLSDAPPAYVPQSPAPQPPSETALLGAPRNPPPPPAPVRPAYVPAPQPEFVPFKMAPIPNPVERQAPPRVSRRVESVLNPKAAQAPAASPLPQPAKSPVTASTGGNVERLGKALAADVAAGSRLAIPEGLESGREGIVILTLPNNLTARVKDEAAKLGLAGAATTANVRATLSGQGYHIMPSEAQIARLGDTPVRFSWQVSENPDAKVEKLPLRAELTGELTGGGKIQRFALAAIGAMPAPMAAPAPTIAKPTFMSRDGLAMIIPLALILIALFILGRWAKSRQVDKDRRRATLEQFHT